MLRDLVWCSRYIKHEIIDKDSIVVCTVNSCSGSESETSLSFLSNITIIKQLIHEFC